jgi:hypothetical protein
MGAGARTLRGLPPALFFFCISCLFARLRAKAEGE